MEKEVIEKAKEQIQQIIDEGINPNNIEHLYKLVDIYKDIKEVKCMNYGNYYGRYDGRYIRDDYGRYDDYGARRRDSRGRYMGHEHLDRMYDDYGRYEEGRQRYGANEDTKRSLQYMLKSMEDFAHMLKEEAQSQEEVQMIRETAQRIAQM